MRREWRSTSVAGIFACKVQPWGKLMQTAVDASPTRNVQLILQIVDGIYAAGCGEATWDQVLAGICQLGRLDGAALSTAGADEPERLLLAAFGLASSTNPGGLPCATLGASGLVDSIRNSTPGTVFRGRDMIMPDPPITQSRRTVSASVTPAIAWACVIVGKDGRRVVCFEVYRRGERAPGCLEPHDLLRGLAPHLARAWRFGGASRPAPVTPLRVEARPLSEGDVGREADLAGLPETARLRAEFGLTKAEARLALYLAEGLSLASAAQAFDVKLTTIRSQLQQVFAKTGTSRQSELVAMLLSRGSGSPKLDWNPHRSMQDAAAFVG
jgi:DNA-binding CsgD family transcriptional regulator